MVGFGKKDVLFAGFKLVLKKLVVVVVGAIEPKEVLFCVNKLPVEAEDPNVLVEPALPNKLPVVLSEEVPNRLVLPG